MRKNLIFTGLAVLAFSCKNNTVKEETIVTRDTIIMPSQDPPYDPVMKIVTKTVHVHADGTRDSTGVLDNTARPVPKSK